MSTTNMSTTKTYFIRLAVCLTLTLSLIGMRQVSADSLDPAHVPADAQWVIHVDYRSLDGSQMWKKLRQENPMVSSLARSWMNKRYGIDPPADLRSMTMFSRDYREYTGTVVIQAAYKPDKIEARLAKAMEHRKTQWQDHTLHTITLSKQTSADEGPSGDEEMTVVMVDKDTILLASSVDNAKQALMLLAGESPSLDGKDSPLLTDQVGQAWIYGAAINLGELKNHPVSMPIIAQHQQITWSFGQQSDGRLYEQADLDAESEDVAEKMETVLDGIVAYETLWADGSRPMTALIENIEVMRDGKTTGFRWQGPSDQVVAAMDDVFKRLDTWKPLLMKDKRD